jgi:hypothetical protein
LKVRIQLNTSARVLLKNTEVLRYSRAKDNLATARSFDIQTHLFVGKDPTKWYPGDPGWPLHVCSTVSEWLMALSFNLFLLTFVTEFKKVKLDSPKVSKFPKSGVNVVTTNFSDFCRFSAKELAYFFKTNVMIHFLHNIAVF